MLTLPNPLSADILDIIRPLTSEGRVSIAAAVSLNWTNIATYQITTAERGYFTAFGYDVQDPTYDWSGSLVFRVTIADQPMRDFSSFQLQKGTVNLPYEICQKLKPNDRVCFQARRAVVSALAQYVDAVIVGIAWPEKYCMPFIDKPAKLPQGLAR